MATDLADITLLTPNRGSDMDNPWELRLPIDMSMMKI